MGELRIEGRDLSWHMDCKLTLNGARTHDDMRGVWCEGIDLGSDRCIFL